MNHPSSSPWRTDGPVNIIVGTLVLCFCFACLVLAAWREPISFDAYWHLRMGRDLVELGLSPYVDHYSFTFPGKAILAPAYPFQVFLYLLCKYLGVFGGFFAYMTFCGVALILATWVWLRDVKAPAAVGWIVLILVTLLFLLRGLVRPEMLSYAMAVGALILLRRAGPELATRYMVAFGALLLFWGNYHTPVFGYLIMTGFFLDAAFVSWRQGASRAYWVRWVVWGAILTALGFVNPNFTHSIISLLTFSSDWKVLISEYALPIGYGRLGAIYVMLMLALVTLVLLLRARRPGWALIWLLLMYNALLTARMVTPAGIIILPLLPWLLRDLGFAQWWGQRSQHVRWFATAVVLVAAGVSMHSTLQIAQFNARDTLGARKQFPVAMVEYLRREAVRGKVFNDHDSGGFVLNALAPDIQVYIDGRTGILYPLEHLQRWIQATQHASVLREEIERYDIDHVLLKNTSVNHRTAYYTGLLTIDHVTDGFTFWRTEGGSLPLATRFDIEPECFDEASYAAVAAEYERAVARHLPHSPVRTLLAFSANLGRAPDTRAFLQAQSPDASWTDSISRLAAYQAMRLGLYDEALAYIANIKQNEARDLLANAWLRIQRGETDLARRVLTLAANTSWPRLDTTDLVLIRALIDEIMPLGERDDLPAGFVAALDAEFARLGVTGRSDKIQPETFCSQ